MRAPISCWPARMPSAACEDCHADGKRFSAAPAACNACHADDDAHRGSLGTDCAECHDAAAWTPASFDHARTGFELAGAHEPLECKACHADAPATAEDRVQLQELPRRRRRAPRLAGPGVRVLPCRPRLEGGPVRPPFDRLRPRGLARGSAVQRLPHGEGTLYRCLQRLQRLPFARRSAPRHAGRPMRNLPSQHALGQRRALRPCAHALCAGRCPPR